MRARSTVFRTGNGMVQVIQLGFPGQSGASQEFSDLPNLENMR